MSAPREQSTADRIGGWVLGIYAGLTVAAVSFSPWLKAQPWWPWKRNRKAGG